MSLTVFISGVYGGPNPSPGLGVCRSIRDAYPEAELIAVDYSSRSSGIHWHEFDGIWLQRPWNELDLEIYNTQMRALFDSGGYWMSGLDLEVLWLSQNLDRNPQVLSPNWSSLSRVSKPATWVAGRLGLRVPSFVPVQTSDWRLARFCRRRGWNIWLKGPYYDAYRVDDWQQLIQLREELSDVWSTDDLFLQEHVEGNEESVAFAAFKGRLIDCVYMTKKEVTSEGKTWAGQIGKVPTELRQALSQTVASLAWTGGGEIEMIRDRNSDLWLIDWNPRFPAWIHGATLCGSNLPGNLIGAVSGLQAREAQSGSREFARVVVEVPVNKDYPLPPIVQTQSQRKHSSAKHPSGMPMLSRRLNQKIPSPFDARDKKFDEAEESSPQLEDAIGANEDTPSWIHLSHEARSNFQKAAGVSRSFADRPFDVRFAYSIKTNPETRLLQMARSCEFYAEAISGLEFNAAIAAGFPEERIVLNGPGKSLGLRIQPDQPLKAIFCDSLDEFDRLVSVFRDGDRWAKVLGLRLCPPNYPSRFGVEVGDAGDFRGLIERVSKMPSKLQFGIHFHIASNTIGTDEWFRLFDSMVRWAVAIERLSSRRIEIFDAGGGWHPEDWNEQFLPRLARTLESASGALRHIREFIFEPGRAMVQPSLALATRVLEVRKRSGATKEVVVDASIAELPEVRYYPHRFYRYDQETNTLNQMTKGSSQILGRLCMEDDILATCISIPDDVHEGEIFVVSDVGAYDRSMSYKFGTGELK